MNAKKCKRLRAQAQRETVGRYYHDYLITGKGQVMLSKTCTRAVYQQLKREAKNDARSAK